MADLFKNNPNPESIGQANPTGNNTTKDNEINGPQRSTSADALPSTTLTSTDNTKYEMSPDDIAAAHAADKAQGELDRAGKGETFHATVTNTETDEVIEGIKPRPQIDLSRTPNQQDPRTLLAPDSAPEYHKQYHDALGPEDADVDEV